MAFHNDSTHAMFATLSLAVDGPLVQVASIGLKQTMTLQMVMAPTV